MKNYELTKLERKREKQKAQCGGALMGATNITRTVVDVASLNRGDTVEINGQLETVSNKWVKRCRFMGWTYKGQPFRHGIVKITFKVPTSGGFRHE